MAGAISIRTLYALAEVITGGSANSPEPSIGLYRSGPNIERFFGALGYDVTLGGRSRLPFTEDTLKEIARRPDGQERMVKIIEAASDPRDFIRKPEALQRVVDYLNEHLQYDGLTLSKEGLRYELALSGPDGSVGQTPPGEYEYDVALSYASENRDYVERVAEILKGEEVGVYYDKYERAAMWGKDLYVHFDEVFRNRAHFCLVFISEHYARKVWTTHELRSAFARAIEERQEYILPARFDDTELPGLRSSIRYEDLRETTPDELAGLVLEKLSGPGGGT